MTAAQTPLPICRLHSELREDSLYVMVKPAELARPVPLGLTGLRPESRARLRDLVRGDEIPPRVLDELVSLAPRFVVDELAVAMRRAAQRAGPGGAGESR